MPASQVEALKSAMKLLLYCPQANVAQLALKCLSDYCSREFRQLKALQVQTCAFGYIYHVWVSMMQVPNKDMKLGVHGI